MLTVPGRLVFVTDNRRAVSTRPIPPILKALCDLGGSGEVGLVLDRVYEMVKDHLKPADLEPLPSDPTSVRWRNTAQWARWDLVERGLITRGSTRGTWEITEAGRRWLEHESEQATPTTEWEQQSLSSSS
ncbi:MAG: winged helix-turn-helix domain-containing protein [Armatimonadota bacterium]